MIIFITANSFLVFPKLSKAKKSWQLSSVGMLMQYNDSCSRSFRECVYCFSSTLNSRDEFFVEIICFPCCVFRLTFCLAPVLCTQMWQVYKNDDPNKCTTIIIRELVKPMWGLRGVLMIHSFGARGWHLKGLLTHLALVDLVLLLLMCFAF